MEIVHYVYPVLPKPWVVVNFFPFSNPFKLVGHGVFDFFVSKYCRIDVICLAEKDDVLIRHAMVTCLQLYFCFEIFFVENPIRFLLRFSRSSFVDVALVLGIHLSAQISKALLLAITDAITQ